MPLLGRVLVVAALALISVPTSAQTSDGWEELLANHDDEAVTAFTRATASSPNDWRSWFGLSEAYGLVGNDSASWTALRQAVRTAPHPELLLYASVLPALYGGGAIEKPDAMTVLEQALQHGDSLGILRAMVQERLGSVMMSKDDLAASTAWYRRIGSMLAWRVIGPFDNISGSGHDKTFPPEVEDLPTSTYEGRSGARVEWTDLQATRRDGWIDMAQYYALIYGTFYASTYVRSTTEQRVHVRIGTSGSFKLFVNNVEIHGTPEELNNDLDTYIAEITLPKGWSHILVKLGNSEIERCNFLCRITDLAGNPLEGLTVSTVPQEITSIDLRPVRIENPFVARLRAQLAASNDVVTAILLAKALLRNDDAIQAELVLRPFLAQYPDAVLLMQVMRDAMIRGDKHDESNVLLERVAQLRPDLPISITYAFTRAMEAKRIDEASELADRMQRIAPRSTTALGLAIQVASEKRDVIRLRSLVTDAMRDHPTVSLIASAAAGMAAIGPGRQDAAIEVMNTHLAANMNEQGLLVLAELQLQAGRIDDWQKTFDKLIAMIPAAPGFFSKMADVRAAGEQYDVAITLMKRALAIAPTSSDLWHRLGNLHRSHHDTVAARACFEKALAFDPADFDVREALRQVSGLPSPFALLPTANVDSIVAVSPTSVDHPDMSVVMLHSSKQRVVYNGSRSETREEVVLKILTVEGIDQCKEYQVYSGDPDAMTYERSVVRKANGREIQADRNGGFLVFKALEVGDVIHIRHRVREANYGRLASFFEDDTPLNQFVPVLHSSYHLVIPDDQPFKWRVDNATLQPITRSTPFGTHYTWTLQDEPAIEDEASMPDFMDVAKRLRISSIPSWTEVVEWYDEIARPKARSTFEIADVMDSIAPRSARLSDREIVQRVYTYITTNVRYSHVPFRQSGVIPQKGRKTLITRIGDCKDVATLCIAMLAERDIKGHVVLVDTELSPYAKEPLPTTHFDHVIARILLEKGAMYLDLTAPDIPLGCLPTGDVGAFALHVNKGETRPLRLDASMFLPSNISVNVDVRLASDSAEITETITHSGARSAMYRTSWKEMSEDDREKEMTETLASDHPDVVLHSMTVEDLDAITPSITYTITYSVPRYVIEAGDFRIVKIPWYDNYSPNWALSYDRRQHAIEHRHVTDTVREHIRISLPDGFVPSGLDASFVREHATATSSVTSRVERGSVIIDRVNTYGSPYVLPSGYDAYRSFYNDVVTHDRKYLLLMPVGTKVTSSRKRK